MQRATPLLSKLGKIYKIKPHFDILENWEQDLEDLQDVEIEGGFRRLMKYRTYAEVIAKAGFLSCFQR